MGCWAESLGGCGGGLSGEHTISANQFDGPSITLSGLPWCREPKTIGLNSLVSNVLCRDHNTALSPVDDEAKQFRESLEELDRLIDRRRRGLRPPKLKTITIDGPRLERWFLKTLINIALQGKERPPGVFDGETVRSELVEIAYGHRQFEAPCGLYCIATVGERPYSPGELHFQTWVRNEDGAIVGLAAKFHGFRFWLQLPGAPEVNDRLWLRKMDGATAGLVINVEWPEGYER